MILLKNNFIYQKWKIYYYKKKNIMIKIKSLYKQIEILTIIKDELDTQINDICEHEREIDYSDMGEKTVYICKKCNLKV